MPPTPPTTDATQTLTLADVAAAAGVAVPEGADPARPVTGAATLRAAGAGDVASLAEAKYVKDLAGCGAGVVIVGRRAKLPEDVAAGTDAVILRVEDAELAMAAVLERFAPPPPWLEGRHPSAVVHETATLGDGVALGPNVVVGPGASVGDRTQLHANVSVADGCRLGADCVLLPGVVVQRDSVIGDRVVIHPNAVIGADGFGYVRGEAGIRKVPQIGTVEIGDDVEIGAGTCIDRAKMSVTRVGAGTKIDNLVQIGHNVEVGAHCIVCGQTGVAGSATIGDGVLLAGQVAVVGHLTIGAGVQAAGRSAIVEDVPPGRVVSGAPAMPHRQHLREQGATRRLPELVVQVRKLQEQLDRLTAERDGDAST